MKGNYNPFSKTYKILCQQQQTAHQKNLKSVKSIQKSNIQIIQPFCHAHSRTKAASQSCFVQSRIAEPYLVIHKNRPYEKKLKEQRIIENNKIAAKLMNISSTVMATSALLNDYRKHKAYQKISRRYPNGAWRKNSLRLDLTSRILSKKSSKYSTKKLQSFHKQIQQQVDHTNNCYYDQHSLKPKYK